MMPARSVSVLALLFATLSLFVAGEPAVELRVNTTTVQVGQPVIATLTYRWPRSWSVLGEPDPTAALATEYVSDIPPAQRQDSGEESRRTWTITLVATRSGTWELPRPSMRVRPPTGDLLTVTAPRLLIEVGSATTALSVPEARPLWSAPSEPVLGAWWPWVAGAAGVVIIGAGLAWWHWRRARSPAIPLIVRTRQALNDAAALGDPREAATGISVALRRHAGELWSFDGAAATTGETAAYLRGVGERMREEERLDVLRLLRVLDDLRWAPGEVSTARIAGLLSDGLAWIDAVQQRLDAEAAARNHQHRQLGAR